LDDGRGNNPLATIAGGRRRSRTLSRTRASTGSWRMIERASASPTPGRGGQSSAAPSAATGSSPAARPPACPMCQESAREQLLWRPFAPADRGSASSLNPRVDERPEMRAPPSASWPCPARRSSRTRDCSSGASSVRWARFLAAESSELAESEADCHLAAALASAGCPLEQHPLWFENTSFAEVPKLPHSRLAASFSPHASWSTGQSCSSAVPSGCSTKAARHVGWLAHTRAHELKNPCKWSCSKRSRKPLSVV